VTPSYRAFEGHAWNPWNCAIPDIFTLESCYSLILYAMPSDATLFSFIRWKGTPWEKRSGRV